MSLFVQIVNNEVKQCWDTPPPDGVGNNGWKNAVEIRPNITANRQGYTAHTFDLSTDPVQIVYGTFDISVDERKGGMKANAGFEFQRVIQEQARDPSKYDPTAVAAAQAAIAPKILAIDAATSHDELDALM
jgi:hypothetical protein